MKKLKTFEVTCTRIYNGSVQVQANNCREALDIAREIIINNPDKISWEFGEETADYADEIS